MKPPYMVLENWGPLTFLFMKENHSISPSEYQSRLHPEELLWSKSLKNHQKKIEFLNSRLTLHEMIPRHIPLLRQNNSPLKCGEDYQGSLSHKNGHIAALLGPSHKVTSVGIDLERVCPIFTKLKRRVCTPDEERLIESLKTQQGGKACYEIISLLFSFKESIYKCYQKMFQEPLFFHHLTVNEINEEKGLLYGILTVGKNSYPIVGQFRSLIIDKKKYVLTWTYIQQNSN